MTSNKVYQLLNEYLDNHDSELCLPYIKDFCLESGLDLEELKDMGRRYPRTIGRCLDRLEMQRENLLQRGGLNKTLDRTFATFCLKQMGWRDTVENETKHEINFNGDMSKWAK